MTFSEGYQNMFRTVFCMSFISILHNISAAIRRFNIAEMMPLVRALGGWPVFDPTWDENKFDWRVPAAASTLWNPRDNNYMYPRGYLVGVKPDRDFEDTSKYILYVSYLHLCEMNPTRNKIIFNSSYF